MNRDLGTVADIVEAARRVQEFLRGVSREEFVRDQLRQSAVIREMQVAGEAAKRVSPGFREQHPSVPWSDMARLRDRLIHCYDDLDFDRIWETATGSLQIVRAYLEDLLGSEP
ncbi:MAG: DUF86 domain-containing protein [Planctomycetes bacterium]|nr:DUF86 domain-containing protein [Planctomycetota bacterium]